jgi:hypothetical protein
LTAPSLATTGAILRRPAARGLIELRYGAITLRASKALRDLVGAV